MDFPVNVVNDFLGKDIVDGCRRLWKREKKDPMVEDARVGFKLCVLAVTIFDIQRNPNQIIQSTTQCL